MNNSRIRRRPRTYFPFTNNVVSRQDKSIFRDKNPRTSDCIFRLFASCSVICSSEKNYLYKGW